MSVIMEAPFLLLLTGGLIFTLRTKSFPEDSRDLLLTLFFPNRKRFLQGVAREFDSVLSQALAWIHVPVWPHGQDRV